MGLMELGLLPLLLDGDSVELLASRFGPGCSSELTGVATTEAQLIQIKGSSAITLVKKEKKTCCSVETMEKFICGDFGC
ncbi:hypothetical protein HanRHA438_Chr12g0540421 [Helianthus annuus]|nr:hypothetical protein HanRHA438_Chr12g0540421 [Helianthus annuus]